MTRKEIIDGLEIYTVGRLKKVRVDITVEELQRFIDAIKTLEEESCEELDFVQPHKKIFANLEVCKMREATQREREGIDRYIDSIVVDSENKGGLTREEAKEELIQSLTDNHIPDPEAVEMAIKDLDKCDKAAAPSVTPAEKMGHWIPVSEKLPNLDDYTGSKVWQKKVLITGYLSFDDKKELFVSEAFINDVINNSVHDTVVTAWMPLPETYKGESEE